jgi:hypothetical protein
LVSYFSDKSGEYKLIVEAQDGLAPPREIALEHPTHYCTPAWSPDSKKILYTDTNLNVWVMDVGRRCARARGWRGTAVSSTSSRTASWRTSTCRTPASRATQASTAGIWGPKVIIINEMAGSGGDLMPYMFHRRKIGPLVGKRTWGGLVHTADTPTFVDGGSMIAPRGGFFDRDGKWAVENEGVAPDVDVENWPMDVIAGRDPQLERAVQEARRLLKEKPVERMMKEPPPPTHGKRKGGGS